MESKTFPFGSTSEINSWNNLTNTWISSKVSLTRICRNTLSMRGVSAPHKVRCHFICFCCSVTMSCLTLCDPMDCSMPGSSLSATVSRSLLKFVTTESVMLSNHFILSPFCLPVLSLSQHQDLFQRVSSPRHVAKVWELQLQHQSFQGIFRVDFL